MMAVSAGVPGRLKKVIGFDNWTTGSFHFTRLVAAFREAGYELILIHIGSWGHDKDRAETEYISDLRVHDIRHYKGKGFREILELENPAAVIFLSTRAFAHQAFNRYATELNIPTLHLYHGLVRVQAVSSTGQSVHKINLIRQASLIKGRLSKNLFVLWPLYCRALFETRATARDWYYFAREIYLKSLKGAIGVAPPDTRTTAGCVYVPADIDDMVVNYGMPANRVHAVGNPDLAYFGLSDALIGFGTSRTDDQIDRTIMYIDTALAEAGMVFANASEFIEHLVATKAALARQGYRFVVKLHPAHFRSGVADLLRVREIEICSNEEFVARLKSVAAVIVEPTTAAMLPALMGLPVLLGQYDKLASLSYGEVLLTYPRARLLRDLTQLENLIKTEKVEMNPDAISAWIRDNAGPMPADQMPHRVAAVVDAMIREYQGSGKLNQSRVGA